MFAFGETVTVVPGPVAFDQYGDPVNPTRTGGNITGCAVAPRYSTEPTARGQQGVIVGLSVYAPAGSDILSTDLLTVRGNLYQVEGEPAEWINPYTGHNFGIEVAVKRAVGA
jgi:hypothetical protein